MKVSAFIDRSTISSQFSVNCIYRLSAYKNPLKTQSSYTLDFNRSLYLVGGRASIAQFCRDNPFRLTSGQGKQFVMEMTRGVPGLTEKERKAKGLDKEAFLSTAIGIFKKKMLTVVQIQQSNIPTSEQLVMPTASSKSLPEMMDLHEATAVQGILSLMQNDSGMLESAIGKRNEHNKKFR